MKYLQDRGGKVYLWLPIGCVPTTFMERYPELQFLKNRP
jgi:hypothetical protein